MRRDKQRDEAAAVAALRRPGWDDWALNAVAVEQPETVGAFTGAAADVRDAQAAAIEGRDGPDIREALRTLRERSAELVTLATEALSRAEREPGPGELNARLAEVAASDTAGAQLRAAVLGSGDAAPGDLFGELEPAPRPKTAKKKVAAKPATTKVDDKAEARRQAAIAAATERHDAATAAVAAADADVAAAEAEVRRAERQLVDAQRAREKAAKAAERTAAALERAEA